MISEVKLIQNHIAEYGVRRFERGCSGNFHAIQDYLQAHGYTLRLVHGVPSISNGMGRPKRMSMGRVVAEYVDPLRVAEGLSPFGIGGAS